MKIGIFDSGLGGLAVTQGIVKRLPQYDYLYLGDTKRVPYGNRSQETIHEFLAEALSYLFENDCQLIIIACNTASAEALRKSQQEYLPANYPERRILGVLIPGAEAALEGHGVEGVGVLATAITVDSGSYERELLRIAPSVTVFQQPAPLLVPLVENDGLKYVEPILADYLAPLKVNGVERLILGCTHYCLLKDQVRRQIDVPVIAQDEIVPDKLADYLTRHPEIETKLSRGGTCDYRVTDLTKSYHQFAQRLTGEQIDLQLTRL